MANERQVIIEYYERIRQKQKSEGTYNPYLNGNVAPEDGHINPKTVVSAGKSRDLIDKYRLDPTLI